jgi:hypothetical protein
VSTGLVLHGHCPVAVIHDDAARFGQHRGSPRRPGTGDRRPAALMSCSSCALIRRGNRTDGS